MTRIDPPVKPKLDQEAAGRRRWIEGGGELLRSGGPASVKLRPLAAQVGLSTGSFYHHHFGGFAAYLEELAADFSGEGLEDAIRSAEHSDPRERLRRFLRIHHRREVDDLASAMRAWGRSFQPAARAVSEAETRVLRYFEQIFRELGSDRTTARAQATLVLATGIAQVKTPWRQSAAERRRAFELILGEDPQSQANARS